MGNFLSFLDQPNFAYADHKLDFVYMLCAGRAIMPSLCDLYNKCQLLAMNALEHTIVLISHEALNCEPGSSVG